MLTSEHQRLIRHGVFLFYNKKGTPINAEEYIRLRSDPKYFRIARTELHGTDGTMCCLISTVWLGMDNAYLQGGVQMLFETTVWSPIEQFNGLVLLSATHKDARAKHREVAAMVRQALADTQCGQWSAKEVTDEECENADTDGEDS